MGIVIEMPQDDATINELRKFCRVNEIKFHHKHSVETLRLKARIFFDGFDEKQNIHAALIWLKRRSNRHWRVLSKHIEDLKRACER